MHHKPLVAVTLTAIAFLFACKKGNDDCKPGHDNTLRYRSLNDEQVKNLRSLHLDIDEDGTHEIYLALGVSGGAEGMRGKFFAAGINNAKLLVKSDSTICLEPNEAIHAIAPHPRDWKGMESYLVEAFIPAATPDDTVWTGNWLDASRKYMGVQFSKGGVPYMGWVCVSMDRTSLALIMHGCAWRRLQEGELPAGKMPGTN